MTRSVFVDSWAWIAMMDDADPQHQLATQSYSLLKNGEAKLVTSSVVIYETLENLRRRFGLDPCLRFWSLVHAAREGALDLIYPTQSDEVAAVTMLRKFSDQDLSIVDCLSFAIMQRTGIEVVFSKDWHFRLLGFVCLPEAED